MDVMLPRSNRQRRRHFPDLGIHKYLSECERNIWECDIWNSVREFSVLELLKLRRYQYLQRIIRPNIRTSILCSNWLPVYYVLWGASHSRYDSISIMSDVARTSVHQLCHIHLSISLTLPHLHGTSATASSQSVLISDWRFLYLGL
jgi:hypothetical protein